MKIIFIGCVEMSCALLQEVLSLRLKKIEVVGIVTKTKSSFNSDFETLAPIAENHRIPCVFADKVSEVHLEKWIKSLKPDVIYCFGWSHLLGKSILKIPRIGCVGFHPAALPQNRGRHPIIWALALGLEKTASTFFFMCENADSGSILNQKFISISKKDDACTLYDKIMRIAVKEVKILSLQLANNTYVVRNQNAQLSNVWRKRNALDGRIDWRMSAESIYNLIRALTKPYPGATVFYRSKDIPVWKSKVVRCSTKNIEPGKVLSVKNKVLTVKCGDNSIALTDHEFKSLSKIGDYLI